LGNGIIEPFPSENLELFLNHYLAYPKLFNILIFEVQCNLREMDNYRFEVSGKYSKLPKTPQNPEL